MTLAGPRPSLACPCDGSHLGPGFAYAEPPTGEVRFELAGAYARAYRRCGLCGHWFSHHDMDMRALYEGAYVSATYGDRMRATFDRIMALPPERSDNAGRVARINAFMATHRPTQGRRLLDVGAGLAVFPARMKAAGWDCTALDPDPRASAHAREVVGVAAVTADFTKIDRGALGRFDLVTFNKVLEHVEHPVAMLAAARALLADGGIVYVEVPDGEAASAEGPGREEFFIDHHHVFSPASLALLSTRAGFSPLAIERLREPSTKFTLRAFLAPTAPSAES